MHTMTHGRAIDGDEPLFVFDASEDLEESERAVSTIDAATSAELFDMSHIPHFSMFDLSSFSAASTPAEVVDHLSKVQTSSEYFLPGESETVAEVFSGKGKAVSRPMDILPSVPRDNGESHFDLFSFSAVPHRSRRKAHSSTVPSSPISSPPTLSSFSVSPRNMPRSVFEDSIAASVTTETTTPSSSYAVGGDWASHDTNRRQQASREKGKSRAEPPVLPPLSFSPAEFARGETSWPMEGIVSLDDSNVSEHASPPVAGFWASSDPDPQQPESSTSARRCAPRTRSFSSFPSQTANPLASRGPMANGGLTLVKGRRQGNLSRKLQQDCTEYRLDQEGCVPTNTPIENVSYDLYASISAPSTPYAMAVRRKSFGMSDASKPSVLAMDKAATQDLFERMLPKEIKIRIFQKLLDIHEAEYKRMVFSSAWTALKATQAEHRLVGKEKGFLELIRISRVCKSWREVVFDGQIWANLNLQAFPEAPPHFLLHLASLTGSFVRSINLMGNKRLSASSLLDITGLFCMRVPPSVSPPEDRSSTTQLTDINLSGCSAITTHALHDILIHSPLLIRLNLRGMIIVTNETCMTLARYCPAVVDLDLSQCHNMDADGIISLIKLQQTPQDFLPLKALRLSGLKRVNNQLMSLLGGRAPNVEVLDLSGARELHNSALEAFVACSEGEDCLQRILTSREVGGDPGDPTKYRRRVTNLRHLSLSHCPLLTDMACSHLAYALPKLEFLELAGIGSELKDEGLVRLLSTTPLIRRLDLDEACDITDATIVALTPPIVEGQVTNKLAPETGSQLEQLNVSYAAQLTNDAMLSLIRACPQLKRLELDNTRVLGITVKEFVRLLRKRQTSRGGITVVDCRGVGENAVKDLVGSTRTRDGWRGWDARHLHYLDARDNEKLSVGTDECDEKRVVLKSFYSWQTVDAVEVAREKQRKANRKNGRDIRTGDEEDYFSARKSSSKWWSPGARRGSGSPSPGYRDRDSCIVM